MKLIDYQCVNRSDFKPGSGPVHYLHVAKRPVSCKPRSLTYF